MEDAASGQKSDLRKIGHELANQLFVVTMGVEVLAAAREDPERFAKALDAIRRDGLEPMSEMIDRLFGDKAG